MKKFTLFLLGLIACFAIGVTWLYLHKEGQAESAIKKQLTAFGLDVKEVKVTGCGLDLCSISTMRIGDDDFTLMNAAAQYTAGTLYEKRIDSLEIETLFIRAKLNEDVWNVGGYSIKPLAKDAPSSFSIPVIPLRALSVKTLKMTIDDGKTQNTFVMEGVKFSSSSPVKYTLSIANILYDAKVPAFIPLKLDMDLTVENNTFGLIGVLTDVPSKGLSVDLKGEWDAGAGNTQLKAELKPLTFEPGVLQPQDLVPLAAGLLGQVRGQVSGKAEMNKAGAAAMQQSAALTLKGLSANLSGIIMTGADGTLEFASLSPLLTKGKQTIHVAKMEAGVPLLDGKIQFETLAGNIIALYPMKWSWSGGSLITDKMNINPAAPFAEQIRLHVRQIDLNSLLALVLDKGVEATGKLDGTIPIRISKGQVVIDNASLMATAPGKVVYKPADPSIAQSGGEQTKLLMKALENFQFKLLSMSVNSKEDGNSVIGLKVTGSNPDLYEGKAIELNVNLQGRLEEIIKQNVDALALPSRIEKQLQENKQ